MREIPIEQTREKVVSHLLTHLAKADGFTKQQIITKLVNRLPDDFVVALDFAYDLYTPEKGDK